MKATYFRNVLERFAAHKLAVAGLIVLLCRKSCLVLVLPPLLHLDPYTSDPICLSGHLPVRNMCWAPMMWGVICLARSGLWRPGFPDGVACCLPSLACAWACLLGLICRVLSQIAGGNHHAHCRHLYVVPRYDSGFGISCCRRTVCVVCHTGHRGDGLASVCAA